MVCGERVFITARDVIVDENDFMQSIARKSEVDDTTCNINKVDLQNENSELAFDESKVVEPRVDSDTESNNSERSMKDLDVHSNSELRRSKRLQKISPVSYNFDNIHNWLMSASREIDDIPNSFSEVLGRSDENIWRKAIAEELLSHEKNKTRSLVEVSTPKNLVDCKWIFTIKTNEYGNITKYKARLVARGFTQEYLTDYNETFAPVVRISSFRFMLAFANNNDLLIHHMDVKTAFLNGDLKEEIFMILPEGLARNRNCI